MQKRKVALVVHKVTEGLEDNLSRIKNTINTAANNGADLVCFSETALTGLINNDDPEHDIKLGIEVEDPIIRDICTIAKTKKVYVSIGFFEREENFLYDTAILINREGDIILKYRRMSKGWHDPRITNSIYREGNCIETVETDFGRVCYLICGDLFDEKLVELVKQQKLDLLLFPYARSFVSRTHDQEEWNKEILEYAAMVRKANVLTVGSNYLDDEFFGGAFVISKDGTVLGNMELGKEAILYYEI